MFYSLLQLHTANGILGPSGRIVVKHVGLILKADIGNVKHQQTQGPLTVLESLFRKILAIPFPVQVGYLSTKISESLERKL